MYNHLYIYHVFFRIPFQKKDHNLITHYLFCIRGGTRSTVSALFGFILVLEIATLYSLGFRQCVSDYDPPARVCTPPQFRVRPLLEIATLYSLGFRMCVTDYDPPVRV